MLVVDASALLEVLLGGPEAARVGTALVDGPACAPDLIDADVLHRLVTLAKHGVATNAELEARVGLYVALARHVAGTLVTADARLGRIAHERLGVTVEVLS